MPLTWDAKTGANIRWTTAIPLHGLSSPVVWSNSVFLTGANDASNAVFRLDADSGRLLWSALVKLPGGARPPAPKVGDDTSLAAPTPVTDGRRVYALFPNGLIAAFDFAGRQVWARNIGPLDNSYGYAASLAIYQDRLLIQSDRGQPEDGQSRLLALDTLTGRDRWQVPRPVSGSWASPIVVTVDGQPQLITCANPYVIAYQPVDGRELWRAKGLESDVAPSPILASNLFVVVAPNTAIRAVRAGGQGDVTATHLAWKAEDGVPDATSPVSDGKRLYIVNSEGLLTCYNLQTGKVLWVHEYDDRFYASPTIAGQVLILLSRKGVAYLLAAGDKFDPLGQGGVGEECSASPVPVGRRLYLRGKNHLFCIEAPERK
ncbi:MAG: PQQ-binding-like beta-propeller repeat protein [Kiritimatiellaeota bacterium]|nr:PQQ-binding-like beta-propeller repeat protein [Kiritimatiellota bacterium]